MYLHGEIGSTPGVGGGGIHIPLRFWPKICKKYKCSNF